MYIYICMYIYIYIYIKGESGITPTPDICKETRKPHRGFVLICQHICFHTNVSDLIPSWKSSFVYFIESLYDTLKDNRNSCFVLTWFIKSLHTEAFKTDFTFLGIQSKHSVKRYSTPKGKRILHFSSYLNVIFDKSTGE